MKYNFDEHHDRSENQAIKLEFLEPMFGEKELLPMWVADMDFPAAQPILDALKERLEQGIFGYTALSDTYYNAFVKWVDRRHNWSIKKDHLIYSPGVVPSLIFSVLTMTNPGDKVIIQTPVYGPFKSTVENHGRQVVLNPLNKTQEGYKMDLEDLKSKIDDQTKMILFCNPHNPVGKVWSKEDLQGLAELVVEHDLVLVSDEIHSDLILKGHKHFPIASFNKEIASRTITCMAPTKTFNLAGLQTSVLVVENDEMREKLKHQFEIMDLKINNCFGQVAFEAAYDHGEEWLDQLLDYIEGNIDFSMDYIEKNIPEISVSKPEGTYLMWFDMSSLNLTHKELMDFVVKEAKLAMTSGDFFGQEGRGYMRYNVATTRAKVKKGLEQLETAIKRLR